ncbi:hypothetical protein GE061_001306 [Apolygus lucorum]|uniref:Uncharacterized protein n=1 Tax=Apolygus lucorum TaxID=248454 RepID=A0A6A4IKF8_APOLU|nr:hypothetical protein GE061_001306 [Apolygus lucorum]
MTTQCQLVLLVGDRRGGLAGGAGSLASVNRSLPARQCCGGSSQCRNFLLRRKTTNESTTAPVQVSEYINDVMEFTEVFNQSIPELEDLDRGFNFSTNTTSLGGDARAVSDVWVSIVLILMTLSCIGCLCSCLLYYKFQKWKVSDGSESTNITEANSERRPSKEGPPSYTVVTGLPTYEQAVVLCVTPIHSSGRTAANTPIHNPYLQGADSQISNIVTTTAQINRTKGVYPNPPLTPPTVSPARVPTCSVPRPVVEVQHIKI